MQHNLVFKVLDVLSDGKFHSGESIAKTFDISRVSIWNAIKKAEEFGVEIYSVRGRGYKLIQPIMLLKKPSIEQVMGEIHHWFNLEIFDVMDSTNSYLMEKASLGHPHASVAATHIQTKGRGRRGRSWQSALGESLTFSLLWRFNGGAATLSGLSLAVGVAIIRSLHRFGVLSAQLKWPNDVLSNGAKLSGILVEGSILPDGTFGAVIGCGINVSSHPLDTPYPATDLAEQGLWITVEDLFAALAQSFRTNLDCFDKGNGFSYIRSRWIEHARGIGGPISVRQANDVIEGTFHGLDDQGKLLLAQDGKVTAIIAGDVFY
jgi:BirA family biotin operon repressor/biotin-[acetyl-CoA-carboxylase] ligase